MLAIIDAGLELWNLQIKSPELFCEVILSSFEFSLSVIPEFQNSEIIGMTGILSDLRVSGGKTDRTSEKPAIVALSEVCKQTFGFVLMASMTVKADHSTYIM